MQKCGETEAIDWLHHGVRDTGLLYGASLPADKVHDNNQMFGVDADWMCRVAQEMNACRIEQTNKQGQWQDVKQWKNSYIRECIDAE